MSNVRQAFRDDNSAITVSAGKITFNSGTFVLNSTNCSISEDGTIAASNAVLMSAENDHSPQECRVEEGGISFYYREYDVYGSMTGIRYVLSRREQVGSITVTSGRISGYSDVYGILNIDAETHLSMSGYGGRATIEIQGTGSIVINTPELISLRADVIDMRASQVEVNGHAI